MDWRKEKGEKKKVRHLRHAGHGQRQPTGRGHHAFATAAVRPTPPTSFLLFLFSFLLATTLSAQRDQVIPPFLQPKPQAQVVEVEGRTFVIRPFRTPEVRRDALGPLPQRGSFLDRYVAAFGFDNQDFITYPYLESFGDTPNALSVLSGLRGPSARFDYQRAAPHLAFFCRLEINEAAGYVIPLKFRLGGHRSWQTDLRRRD